jgi:hypothetical protein
MSTLISKVCLPILFIPYFSAFIVCIDIDANNLVLTWLKRVFAIAGKLLAYGVH